MRFKIYQELNAIAAILYPLNVSGRGKELLPSLLAEIAWKSRLNLMDS